jgi:hypothetical protein
MTYATSVTGPFYHGTRADLAWAICSRPGCASHSFASTSNYADRKLSWICFSGGFPHPPGGFGLVGGFGAELRPAALPPPSQLRLGDTSPSLRISPARGENRADHGDSSPNPEMGQTGGNSAISFPDGRS